MDKTGSLFYDKNGKKRRTCDLEGPDHGCSGTDWWHDLPYKYEKTSKT